MAFLASMAFGFASGLGFIYGLSYFQKKRSKQRMQRAVAIAALTMADQLDIKKLLKGDLLPEWVQFPEWERVHWLNKELKEIWPYVNKAASALIKDSVEPILKQYKPPVLLSMKFNKLTLGNIAPQIAGVKVVDSKEEEVILEIDLKFGGNPSIILGMTTLVGLPLQVQVKDVQFFGLFRIVFRPLVGDFPCFGAVTVALRNKPSLLFKLKIIGGEFPGIHGIVDSLLRTALLDSLLWPSRIVVPILPDPTGRDYSDIKLVVQGQIDVKLVEAKDLPNTDLIGKSDPFAELWVRPKPDKIKRSMVKNNTLHPIWNEMFELEVEDPLTQKLNIKILDKEGVQSSEPMGEVSMPLTELQPNTLVEKMLELWDDMDNPKAGKPRGTVRLELIYRPYGPDGTPVDGRSASVSSRSSQLAGELGLTSAATSATGVPGRMSTSKRSALTRGVLIITVIRAEDLVAKDITGTSDPYATVSMKNGDMKKKTKVVPKTLSPEWHQQFEFLVEDATHDMLQLEIWDHDTFGKDFMGRVVLTLTRILHELEYTEVYDVADAASGKLHVHLVWKGLPS